MIWQDLVITIALVVFAVSLVPQVYYGFKRKKGYITLKTSIPTVIGLIAILFAYISLGLYLSTIIGILTTIMWILLLVQRIIYEKV
ncbi:hypothetical protein HYT52_00995 [Candidatus Woesearchaeota archaeon]|nr:hypothetical protein [Candidatus Woesearchaeota archaeon]